MTLYPEPPTKRNISFKVPAEKESLWWPYFISGSPHPLLAQLIGPGVQLGLRYRPIPWFGSKRVRCASQIPLCKNQMKETETGQMLAEGLELKGPVN